MVGLSLVDKKPCFNSLESLYLVRYVEQGGVHDTQSKTILRGLLYIYDSYSKPFSV